MMYQSVTVDGFIPKPRYNFTECYDFFAILVLLYRRHLDVPFVQPRVVAAAAFSL